MRAVILLLCLSFVWTAHAQFATISHEVETEFGRYVPNRSQVQVIPPSYDRQLGFSDIENLDQVSFTPEEQKRLLDQGFVAQSTRFQQMQQLYKSLRDRNVPLLVTTDAVLHTYHILYDYTLRVLEVDAFAEDLRRLTDELLAVSQDQLDVSTTPLAREAIGKNIAFFQVAAALLDSSMLDGVSALASQELELIHSHQGIRVSPLFGYEEDYTQYIPRGHYTRNETLERFFRAMMWYGRMAFRLGADPEPFRLETLQAILITVAMEDIERQRLWDRIYEPTVFFVGKADDLTIRQYREVALTTYGNGFAAETPDALVAKLDAFMEEAKALPTPQINSSVISDAQDFQQVTQGFRFMGQRFIPDSYILFQLTHRRVPGRFLPRGLDVMAVLGSRRAYEILVDVYSERRYPNYQNKLAQLQDEFAAYEPDAWAQNLYWNWLYALMPLLDKKDAGHPTFMLSRAWEDKELATALGSWTELRHDTILYAKQGYTELTSFPPQPDVTRGYVEPNPKVYARLAALAQMMREGLDTRGLALPIFANRLEALQQLLLDLKAISEAELVGIPLTATQYETIWNFGQTLEYLVSFPPEFASQYEGEEDQDMAVVADVHTDPNSGQVLEEGVGHPLLLSAIVPGTNGFKVVQGAMFSYYEFPHPMGDRLTDSKWQEMVNQRTPKLPIWMESFVAGTGFEERPEESQHPRWDINGDGVTDVVDMVRIALHFGSSARTRNAWLDMNADGAVDILDIVQVGKHFGEQVAPAAPAVTGTAIRPDLVWLVRRDTPTTTEVELHASPDVRIQGIQFNATYASDAVLHTTHMPGAIYQLPSVAGKGILRRVVGIAGAGSSLSDSEQVAMLVFQQHTGSLDLALHDIRLVGREGGVLHLPTLRLRENDSRSFTFQLLPNYPNPFNPETWIPYELPKQLPVYLRIYDITGRQIRSMDIGSQPAGHYETRERAIHWDGANDSGEAVASGVYLYQLRAGQHVQQRRMIILK